MPTATAPEIALDDVGTGEPALLCLPGWCGNRDVFDPLVERLSSGRRTLALDLPGHGGSATPAADYGTEDIIRAALAVIERARLQRVVPVALSHVGWVAIELRRRLGPDRVAGVVLLDWMVLGPPPGFLDALAGLQDPAAWEQVRTMLFDSWTSGIKVPALHAYVGRMGRYHAPHWARAGREIATSFAAEPIPLDALARLPEPCPTLHLYAQPADNAVLVTQQDYAAAHPWFAVHRLDARSHFPMFEVPEQMAAVIEGFARSVSEARSGWLA
jgi:pimeloyl-ACP methyl ester carboxylesterase